MGLESAVYVNGLVETNPASGDPKAEGDDHLRNIKGALKRTFPNLTGPMTATQAKLNADYVPIDTPYFRQVGGAPIHEFLKPGSAAWMNWIDTGAALSWGRSNGTGGLIDLKMTLTQDGTCYVPGQLQSGALVQGAGMRIQNNTGMFTFYMPAWGSRYIYAEIGYIGFLDSNASWVHQSRNNGDWWSIANVIAYSDERVKTNWRPLAAKFVERLAKVKSGIYDRTDREMTQVGVSAQSLEHLMPEAVVRDDKGYLSVAYGNAALAACVEMAKSVVQLQNSVALLSAQVETLQRTVVKLGGTR